MWFDTHCHLTGIENDPLSVAQAAHAAGVEQLVTVGCTVADSRQAIEIAETLAASADCSSVWATAGVHPHEAKAGLAGLEDLLDHPRVVAVGECGLDYHYDHSPREVQADVFCRQIELAHRYNKTLVIHTRSAWQDTFDLLDAEGVPARTVFHCFSGGPDEAAECLKRSAWLSFSGIVTFNSAGDVQQAALVCPLDKLLVETDSPYLAPVPLRGKPNRPTNVVLTGEFLAQLLGIEVQELARSSTANGVRAFDIA